jgi:hypothetical protein
MYSNYDFLCVVSEANRTLHFIDFKKLKDIYKEGEYRVIHHKEQTCYCYLLGLWRVKQAGALLGKIKY